MQKSQELTFTAEDLTRIREAARYHGRFEEFLLQRFAAYTQYAPVTDTRGKEVPPITGDPTNTASGYGRWTPVRGWETLNSDTLLFEERISDDRGSGVTIAHTVEVPWVFIFGDTERDERYTQHLALKAEFEPGTNGTDVDPEPHSGFNYRALTVFCPVAGKVVGVTRTFNRCEGCGSHVY